jgi:hypothetical protein
MAEIHIILIKFVKIGLNFLKKRAITSINEVQKTILNF